MTIAKSKWLPIGVVEYKGTWNAATNLTDGSVALSNGAGNKSWTVGDFYRVTTAGSVNFGAGAIAFGIGDYVILNPSYVWERSGSRAELDNLAAEITLLATNVQALVGDEADARVASQAKSQKFTLTTGNISDGYVDLTLPAALPTTASLFPVGGAPQDYGTDFEVITNGTDIRRVSWNGKTLAGELEVGDVIRVTYF